MIPSVMTLLYILYQREVYFMLIEAKTLEQMNRIFVIKS